MACFHFSFPPSLEAHYWLHREWSHWQCLPNHLRLWRFSLWARSELQPLSSLPFAAATVSDQKKVLTVPVSLWHTEGDSKSFRHIHRAFITNRHKAYCNCSPYYK